MFEISARYQKALRLLSALATELASLFLVCEFSVRQPLDIIELLDDIFK